MFVSSSLTERNKHFSRCMNKHSQFGPFRSNFSIKTFSNCRSHSNHADGCPYKFLLRRSVGSWISSHDFGRRILVDDSRKLVHFDSGNRNILARLPFSLECNLPLHHLLVLRILEVWKSHPELWRLSCVKRENQLESSCTTPPRSTTRPLYFWNILSNSAFFEMAQVQERCKMNCFDFLRCFIDHLLFALYFGLLPRWYFPQLVPFCQLRPSHPESSLPGEHKVTFVHEILMTHGLEPSFGVLPLFLLW